MSIWSIQYTRGTDFGEKSTGDENGDGVMLVVDARGSLAQSFRYRVLAVVESGGIRYKIDRPNVDPRRCRIGAGTLLELEEGGAI